jgi:hypothetical protein
MTIRRLEKNYSGVGAVIIPEENPELRNPWCPRCIKFSKYSRLKQRVYLDHNMKAINPPPPDADNWLQCWLCGLLVPIREIQIKSKIAGIQGIQPVDNPYDLSKPKVVGIGDRIGGIKGRYQRLKKKRDSPHHKDKEVQKLMEEGWTVQNYQTSMPT